MKTLADLNEASWKRPLSIILLHARSYDPFGQVDIKFGPDLFVNGLGHDIGEATLEHLLGLSAGRLSHVQ